jgi:hypothetical protein
VARYLQQQPKWIDLMLSGIVVPRHHHPRKTSLVNLNCQMLLLSHYSAHQLLIIQLSCQDSGSRQGEDGGRWLAILAMMVATATAKVTATVTGTAKGWGQAVNI